MRTSLYPFTAVGTAVLGLWLAGGAIGRVDGPGSFMLEVPAGVVSVGQQFQPRLIDTANQATVPETVSVELLDAHGRRLAAQDLEFTGAAAVAGTPWSLPRAGAYRVRANSPSGTQTVALEAWPEPASDFGGIAAVASWGLPAGAVDYLRMHGFAVTPIDDNNDAAQLQASPVIVVGDARAVTAYPELWRAVDQGARLLQLQPPPPGVQAFWPLNAPLRAVSGGAGACNNDGPGGWTLPPPLAPRWGYDLGSKDAVDIYHWDGTYMPRTSGAGYAGCQALFSYRYGNGWVTVSTAPLLEHFQDVRARLDLMALIKAQLRRKHNQPASPGLAWVMQQRLKALAKAPPDPLAVAAAVWYRPPPAPVAPAAVLVPLQASACWNSPGPATLGAAMRLDLGHAQPVHGLVLNFGPQSAAWPSSFELEASADGSHWTPLTAPAIAADGWLSLAVPAAASGGRDFQLTITGASAHAWRLCQFNAR